MNKLIILFAFVFLISVGGVLGVDTTNYTLSYRIESNSISNNLIFDSSPQRVDGIINGATLNTGDGFNDSNNNGALEFDGINDYISLVSDDNDLSHYLLNNGTFTIIAWVKLNSLNNDSHLIGDRNSKYSNPAFFYDNSSDCLRLRVFYGSRSSSSNSISACSSMGEIKPSVWQLWTGVVWNDGTNYNISVYINGSFEDSVQTTNPVNFDFRGLDIGRGEDNNINNYFEGSISDIFIVNRSLNSTEVLEYFDDKNESKPFTGSKTIYTKPTYARDLSDANLRCDALYGNNIFCNINATPSVYKFDDTSDDMDLRNNTYYNFHGSILNSSIDWNIIRHNSGSVYNSVIDGGEFLDSFNGTREPQAENLFYGRLGYMQNITFKNFNITGSINSTTTAFTMGHETLNSINNITIKNVSCLGFKSCFGYNGNNFTFINNFGDTLYSHSGTESEFLDWNDFGSTGTLSHNIMYNFTEDGLDISASNVLIQNNTCRMKHDGLTTECFDVPSGNNNTFTNNVCYGADESTDRCFNMQVGSGNIFKNNIAYGNSIGKGFIIETRSQLINNSAFNFDLAFEITDYVNTTIYFNASNIDIEIDDSHLFFNGSSIEQLIGLSGLTNALIYNTNGSIYGSSTISDNDGNINITLTPNNASFVLDQFNLTEGITRTNSPLAFGTKTDNSIAITSTLAEPINTTIIFSIPNCEAVGRITYTSNTGAYIQVFDNKQISCSGDVVSLDINGIETASGSNVLVWEYGCSSFEIVGYRLIMIATALLLLGGIFFYMFKNGKLDGLTIGQLVALFMTIIVTISLLLVVAQTIGGTCNIN